MNQLVDVPVLAPKKQESPEIFFEDTTERTDPFPPAHPDGEFRVRHMADPLPNNVVQRVRRVVNLHATLQTERGCQHHVCGEYPLRSQDWRLGAFKGARQLYTGQIFCAPADYGDGARSLLEWARVADVNGRASYKFVCNHDDESDS
ncbi:hypothetical protein PG994_002396 [Apiospora phragmitis]|uniref:Uncharacterized protein n=1 Tax=Apiospora phragmitis TaxID=2905665 RepID=A0ABR1WWF5_9PEZI